MNQTEDIIHILLPKLGESITTATVVQWFKKVGDWVELDEPLLEVSTDKVNSEIPAPLAGVLTSILAKVDQEIPVGGLLGTLQVAKAPTIPVSSNPSPQRTTEAEMSGFLSPALLKLAQEKGVNLQVLAHIPGTGNGGRITRKDLEQYLECTSQCASSCTAIPTPASIERIKITGMRKAIADNMVRSFYTAPHASLITEVDVTPILSIIQEHKDPFLTRHGAKLTITCFVARAITRALHAYPLLNASLENDTILVKKWIHLGLAVSIEHGILVPVIKHCERLSLPEIARQIQNIAHKARSGGLIPEDVAEGSITLTNFGMTGVAIGIPIIRYPEIAIIGLGAAQKKVVALSDDTIGVRSMLHISLTFDHRVLDGIYGCEFLNTLKRHIETDLSLSG